MTLRRACVMGHPVAHSRSPMIHGYWLKTLGIPGAYELKDLTPDAFVPFITNLAANGYVGGNVTVPHKEAAFRSVHGRDEAAEAVGAVNTLWLENGKLMGEYYFRDVRLNVDIPPGQFTRAALTAP